MKRLLILGGAASVAFVAILAASQNQIIYIKRNYESHGLRTYYNNLKTQFENKSGRVLLEVSYNTSQGEQLVYWIPPKYQAIEQRNFEKLWLVFGGNAQLGLDWLWFISKLGEDFEKDSFVLFDYPGYGRCQGSPGMQSISESVDKGAERIIELLYQNETDVEPDVGILAHSLGCAAGLNYAASSLYPVNSFILMSPFQSIPNMALDIFVPSFLRSMPLVSETITGMISTKNRWNNTQSLRELGGRLEEEQRQVQMIFIHGDEDEICPFKQGEQVFRTAESLKPYIKSKFITIPGGDHNNLVETAFPQVIRALKARL